MKEAKERKKPVRRVWGRLKGVEVPGQDKVFTFELTVAGVTVRKRNSRKVRTVGFERLASGGGVVSGGRTFTATDAGVEVSQDGSRAVRLVDWATLGNLAQRQPVLFPEEAKK